MGKGRFYMDQRPPKGIVEGVMKRFREKEHPCTPDCPGRHTACQIKCKRLEDYTERAVKERAEATKKANAERNASGYMIESAAKNKKRNRR